MPGGTGKSIPTTWGRFAYRPVDWGRGTIRQKGMFVPAMLKFLLSASLFAILIGCTACAAVGESFSLAGVWYDQDKYHEAAYPQPVGDRWLSKYYNDVNGNGRYDPGEPWGFSAAAGWSNPTHASDGTCWTATAANMLRYIGGPDRYQAWAYTEGVPHGAYPLTWTDAGIVHWALIQDGYHYVQYNSAGEAWDPGADPDGWVARRLADGLPCAVSVAGNAHVVTAYAIDTTLQTITLADSDKEPGGQDYHTYSYSFVDTSLSHPSPQSWVLLGYGDSGESVNITGLESFATTEWRGSGTGGDTATAGDTTRWSRDANWTSPPALLNRAYCLKIELTNAGMAVVDGATQGAKAILRGAGTLVEVPAGGSLSVLSLDNASHLRLLGGLVSASGYVLNEGQIDIRAGTLATRQLFVGWAGQGTVSHQGGACTLSDVLILGHEAGSQGAYTLGSGALSVLETHVGYGGSGTFTQTGGTHTLGGWLYLGSSPGASGNYDLSGGTLDARQGTVSIGSAGAGQLAVSGSAFLIADTLSVGPHGTFSDTAGPGNTSVVRVNRLTGFGNTVSIGGNLDLGHGGGSGTGIHKLTAGQQMAVGRDLVVGYDAYTDFVHSGGAAVVGGSLYVAKNIGAFGVYNLSGGSLQATDQHVGGQGMAQFTQTGGSVGLTGNLYVGTDMGGMGIYELQAGTLESQSQYVGYFGTGMMVQRGGTNTVHGTVLLGNMAGSPGGYYTLESGDLLNAGAGIGVSAMGGFTQTGGTHVVDGPLYVGYYAQGAYDLLSGSLSSTGDQEVGRRGSGTFTQSGGTNHVGGALHLGVVGGSSGTYEFTGGELQGPGGITVRLQPGATAAFRGKGIVGLTGPFVNNGRVEAAAEGTLDLSAMASATNVLDNPYENGTNGWYVGHGGKILLPSVRVTVGADTYNWGEAPFSGPGTTDQEIDLVNSVQMCFKGLTSGGDFRVALLSPDRPELQATPKGFQFLNVWSMQPSPETSLESADLVFRYDDALALLLGIREEDLRVFHYDGAAWVNVWSRTDVAKNLLYADDVASFSDFAVGVPEPATLGLLLLGTLALTRRRRSLPASGGPWLSCR